MDIFISGLELGELMKWNRDWKSVACRETKREIMKTTVWKVLTTQDRVMMEPRYQTKENAVLGCHI